MRPSAFARLAYLAVAAIAVSVPFAPAVAQPTVLIQAVPQIQAEADLQGVRLSLGGVVRDVHGLALSGVEVDLAVQGDEESWSTTVTTDESGRFRWLLRVHDGEWILRARVLEHPWLSGGSAWESTVQVAREAAQVRVEAPQRWDVASGALPVLWSVVDSRASPRVRVAIQAEATCAHEGQQLWTDAQGRAAATWQVQRGEQRRCVVSWQSGADDRILAASGSEVVELVSGAALDASRLAWPQQAWDLLLGSAEGPLERERLRFTFLDDDDRLLETVERSTDTAGRVRLARVDLPSESSRVVVNWLPMPSTVAPGVEVEVWVDAPGAWPVLFRWLAWILVALAIAIALRGRARVRSAATMRTPVGVVPAASGEPRQRLVAEPVQLGDGAQVVSDELGRELDHLRVRAEGQVEVDLPQPWVSREVLLRADALLAAGHLPWSGGEASAHVTRIVLASVRRRVRERLTTVLGRAHAGPPWGQLTIRQWLASSIEPPQRRAAWLKATLSPRTLHTLGEDNVRWTASERTLMALCHQVERILLAGEDEAEDYAAFEALLEAWNREHRGRP